MSQRQFAIVLLARWTERYIFSHSYYSVDQRRNPRRQRIDASQTVRGFFLRNMDLERHISCLIKIFSAREGT